MRAACGRDMARACLRRQMMAASSARSGQLAAPEALRGASTGAAARVRRADANLFAAFDGCVAGLGDNATPTGTLHLYQPKERQHGGI